MGITGDTIMRLYVDRLLGFQMLKAHQLGNSITVLQEFNFENYKIMEDFKSCPPADVAVLDSLNEVLQNWRSRLGDMTDLIKSYTRTPGSRVLEKKEPFKWFPVLVYQLKDLSPPPDFDLSEIAENTKHLQVNIPIYLMQQLVQSLYRNAKKIWEYDINKGLRKNTGRQRFRVAAAKDNGDLKWTFANEGREIADPLREKLFRQPVPRERRNFGRAPVVTACSP